jgi:hypothetical protein
MHIVITIDAIHAPGIEEDQDNENVDGALLGKPEAQLETGKSDRIQLLDKENACAERNGEPDRETDTDETQIGPPVGETLVLVHIAYRGFYCWSA